MPEVRARVRTGDGRLGGVLGYPLKSLFEEVAFVSYHFHWPPESVLNMEHADRRRWVQEISIINQRINSA